MTSRTASLPGFLLVLLSLHLSAGLLVAQLPGTPAQPIPHQPGLRDWPWPSSYLGGSDALSTFEIADVDGDLAPDAIALNGTTLVYMPMFSEHTAMAAIDVGGTTPVVSSFCIVESVNGKAWVAASTAAGLSLYAHDHGAEFTEAVTFAGVPGWEECRQLIAADNDGDGLDDLFGLTSDGLAVRVLNQWSSGAWTSGHVFNLSAPAYDFTPMAWDSPSVDTTLEVAYLTDNGAIVLDTTTTTPLFSRTSPLQSVGDITRVRTGAGQADVLGWVLSIDSLSVSQLHIVDGGVLEMHDLDGDVPTGLAAGDFDGDGDDDLAVTFANTFEVLFLDHHANGPERFDLENRSWSRSTAPVWATSHTGNTVGGAIAHVGGASPEFVLPSPARHSLASLFGPLGYATELQTRTIVKDSSRSCLVEDGTGEGHLRVSFTVTYPDLDTTSANAWRLGVWEQADGASYLAEHAVSTCVDPLVETSPGQYSVSVYLRPDPTATTVPTTIAEWVAQWDNDARVLHVVVLPIDAVNPLDPESDGVRAGGALVTSITFDNVAGQNLPLSDDWMVPDDITTLFQCSDGGTVWQEPLGGFYFVKGAAPTVPGTLPEIGALCLADIHPHEH